MKKIFIILKEDIVHFPPVLSIIHSLLFSGQFEIVFLGKYSDEENKRKLEQEGVHFPNCSNYNVSAHWYQKYIQMIRFRNDVSEYLQNHYVKGDKVWIMHAETICLLSALVKKYDCILHFFEYVEPKINWRYVLLNPFFNMGKTCRKAYKVVCCEYNRAHITKGLFQLDRLPCILPNKLFLKDEAPLSPPAEIKKIIDELKERVKGKNIILYQGVFVEKERRLEEFIEAVNDMDYKFVLIAMGKGGKLFADLKKKYSSDKIIFIDFIRPPYHLLVTQMAKIGVLSYFPRPYTMASVINPIYCAPNKTFEYGKFGVPMISNDIPGLTYMYKEFSCGKSIPYPMQVADIKNAIYEIMNNYDLYSKGSKQMYDSVDFVSLVNEIVNEN